MQPKTRRSNLTAVRVRVILGAAVFAYFVSVIQRSTMGVASLSATVRFDTSAAALSSLAAAQLAVYAFMQIPAGIALDRFGARKLIIFGSILTGMGNLLVAFAEFLPMAVLGRMIVGFGDAFVFISMIRLIDAWEVGPKATRYTQLLANLGQLGQLVSAIPFAYLLGLVGWTFSFGLASSLALIAAAIGVAFLRDQPTSQSKFLGLKSVGLQLRENLSDPFTRKAFWVHFTMQSSGSVFILLWGYTFLVEGEKLDRTTASVLLSSFVFIGFIVGPVLSRLCISFPDKRNRVITSVFIFITVAWLVVILTPGVNPTWQLVFLVLAIGTGGPASVIAFDYSRNAIPKYRLGSSNGIINSGGFVATFITMFLIGVALDLIKALGLLGKVSLYSLEAFKLAFPIQIVVMVIGLAMFYRERRQTQQIDTE
jgi:sugar phosphate permease